MRISDWSSDVCSSDLSDGRSSRPILGPALDGRPGFAAIRSTPESATWHGDSTWDHAVGPLQFIPSTWSRWAADGDGDGASDPNDIDDAAYARSEEHTSELQSLMRISYAVFCLKKKKKKKHQQTLKHHER